jgi:hypothetical protein
MAKKSDLVKYVHQYLGHELRSVSAEAVRLVQPTLSVEEQTLIYKYSEDGYEEVNTALRNSLGRDFTPLAKFLESTLDKLPDYKGLVHRSANLTQAKLDKYVQAFNNSAILVEHSFVSTSKSYATANMFGGNCRFNIISKSGKEIERYAKYGAASGQNEYEVLFKPNCKFDILEITKTNGDTLIIMEEV